MHFLAVWVSLGLKGLVKWQWCHTWVGGGYLGRSRIGAEETRPGREILIDFNQVFVVGPRLGGKQTGSTHPQDFLGSLVEMARGAIVWVFSIADSAFSISSSRMAVCSCCPGPRGAGLRTFGQSS